MKLKKIILGLTLMFLIGCNVKSSAKNEVNVYVAASLENAMNEIVNDFEKNNDVNVLINSGSSENLMLQIEVFADKSLLPCIVNGKKIPFEYKEIYEELVKNIKKLEQEKTSYYRYAIDWRAYEKLNVTEKLDYIDDLASKIVNNFIDNPSNILWNGKKYILDQKDVPLFWKVIEMFEQVKKECQDKVKEFEQ